MVGLSKKGLLLCRKEVVHVEGLDVVEKRKMVVGGKEGRMSVFLWAKEGGRWRETKKRIILLKEWREGRGKKGERCCRKDKMGEEGERRGGGGGGEGGMYLGGRVKGRCCQKENKGNVVEGKERGGGGGVLKGQEREGGEEGLGRRRSYAVLPSFPTRYLLMSTEAYSIIHGSTFEVPLMFDDRLHGGLLIRLEYDFRRLVTKLF